MYKNNLDLVNSFLTALLSLNLSEKTVKIRRFALRDFFNFIGEKRVQDITEKDITGYACSLSALSENTIYMRMISLKLFFKWLGEEFMIICNPAAEIKLKKPAGRIPRTLTPEQIDTVMESIDTAGFKGVRNRAFLEVAYSTGARRSELIHLKLQNTDLVRGLITVYGKGAKERILPIGSLAVNWLKTYLNMRPQVEADDLWLNYQDNKISSQVIESLFRHIRKTTGLSCSCHTLRRSCATHLLQNGMHPALVCEILGHSSFASLKSYLKVEIEELKETQGLLGGRIWKQL